ncbi:MAG: YadA-like family protein [Pseudomonadota bacterium]
MDGAETTMAANATEIETHARQISSQADQLQTVSASVSTNQLRIAESADAITANRTSITQLESGVERLDLSLNQMAHGLAQSNRQIEQNSRGIAIANALAGSTWLQSNESVAFSLNAGYFDGSNALAFSGAARLHRKWSANLAIGTAPERGEIGARAGLRVGW